MNAEQKIYQGTYQGVLHKFEEKGWHIEPQTITHRDDRVSTHHMGKGYTCRILEIKCPPCHILLICGVDKCGINPGDIARAPHLYTIPHQFSIVCYDQDNMEPSSETMIWVERLVPNDGIFPVDKVFYGDMALKSGERIKRKEERYYFTKDIALYGGESLCLTLIQPERTIERTELYLKCDYLTKVG